ncbi:MAG: type II toxin-antitoxin system VapC family toxin [Armatimonadetes bacterium]|nr:type II toxin-antitoxin system VapC family toxin [Armatimonadota bacterium]
MSVPRWAYADTSVLVKRYVREPGSSEAGRLTSAHDLVTSRLARVEIISALYTKHRGGTLPDRSLATALERCADERRWWTLVELAPVVLSRAEDVIRRIPTRTADAIHIASALFFKDATGTDVPFLTSDARQRSSAEAVGLRVLWV